MDEKCAFSDGENILKQEKQILASLYKKAINAGADLKNIKIKFLIEGNRFITAAKKLKKDDTIMMIPNDFYYNRILNEEINLYYKEIIELEESAQICVFLYFLFEIEKKEKSENLYYIDCLPKDETYFPVFFSDENKDLLKGSIIIDYINKNIQKFKKEFQILKNKFSKLNTVEFKDYLKVRLTLGARIFDTDKINYVNSAVPIADLFNFHPEKVNCYWKVDENNNFYVKAIRDIEEEEEIYLFYGNYDNLYFLFWYAFTIEDNPEKIKSYLIEFDDYKILEFKIRYDFSEIFEEYCKIRKTENLLKSNNILKNKLKTKNIQKILIELKNIIQNRLSIYCNKSIELDKEKLVLYNCQKDYNKVNILNVIIEEKSILLEYLKIIESIIDLLKIVEKGGNICTIYSSFLENYPNDQFVKFLFSSY